MNLKKICFYLVIASLIMFSSSTVKAEDNYYEDFGPFFNIELNKEWNITFNQSIDIKDNVKVWVEDSLKAIVPTAIRSKGNTLVIAPKNQYKQKEQYTLYISRTLSNKLQRQQKMIFTTKVVDTEDLSLKQRISEIQQEWNIIKPIYDNVDYIVEPSTVSPYSLGQLTDEVLNDSLEMTNFIRYIAYLPNNVTLDNQFNIEAQASSVVNAANNQLTHYPKKPQDMDDNLFKLGYKGSYTSNIAYGFKSITDSIVRGYMEDGDSLNISEVGHRLWILSPKLKKVGFGFARANNNAGYTAMKVNEGDMYYNTSKPYDYISWPSKTAIPTKFFKSDFPWSISLNTEIYDNSKIDDIKVTLTRINDNKTWNINKESNDGYFNVSTANYGYLPFTIIFRPNDQPQYNDGDKYRVTISNIKRIDGKDAVISFETTFFDLID